MLVDIIVRLITYNYYHFTYDNSYDYYCKIIIVIVALNLLVLITILAVAYDIKLMKHIWLPAICDKAPLHVHPQLKPLLQLQYYFHIFRAGTDLQFQNSLTELKESGLQ